MKRLQIILLSLVVFLFTSCGNGSLEECEVVDNSFVILNEGDSANVYPEDILEPNTNDAIYNINDIFGQTYKQITILKGSAKLIYGSYNIIDYPRQ